MIGRSVAAVKSLPGVYQVRRELYRRKFFRGEARFWGEFPSADAARSSLPDPSASEYDDTSVVDINIDGFLQLQLFDWPVLCQLRRLIREEGHTSLVDFGGHIGVKYYALRDHLDLPDDFRWHVVDVPAMVREGERRAPSMNGSHLSFTSEIEPAPPSRILLCSGALQYVGDTLPNIVAKMARKPDVIILNKVPVCRSGGLFTLENFGKPKIPYQIFSPTEIESYRQQLGYDCIAEWPIPERDFHVPYAKASRSVEMRGLVWQAAR